MNSNNSISSPYAWLRYIDPAIAQHDEIPLFGYMPPFSWSQLVEVLQPLFQLPSLAIIPSNWQWRHPHELLIDIGESLIPTGISVTPLEGSAYWIMPDADLNVLMSKLLMPQSDAVHHLSDEELRMGFYRYLTVEVLYQLDKAPSFNDLTLRLVHHAILPEEPCSCLDVRIEIGSSKMIGRVIVPSTLRASWKKYALQHYPRPDLDASRAKTLEVQASVEIDSISLSQEQWSTLSVGDFIALPSRNSWQPEIQKEEVLLAINGTPICTAELQNGRITISKRLSS